MAEVVTICGGCGGGPFVGPLQARLADVRVVDCMNVCGRPVAVSFRSEGKAAYLFAGVDLARQAEEIIVFAGLYTAAKAGIIDDARPCGQLRLCLVGRIPG